MNQQNVTDVWSDVWLQINGKSENDDGASSQEDSKQVSCKF